MGPLMLFSINFKSQKFSYRVHLLQHRAYNDLSIVFLIITLPSELAWFIKSLLPPNISPTLSPFDNTDLVELRPIYQILYTMKVLHNKKLANLKIQKKILD